MPSATIFPDYPEEKEIAEPSLLLLAERSSLNVVQSLLVKRISTTFNDPSDHERHEERKKCHAQG
jgi:hypothetical protein